jgi:hypothetical protein
VAEAEIRCSDLLPTGTDDTLYRLITTQGASTCEVAWADLLRVAPEAIRKLTAETMEKAFAATGDLNDKLHADGYRVFPGGHRPRPSSTARVTRRWSTTAPASRPGDQMWGAGSSTSPTSTER